MISTGGNGAVAPPTTGHPLASWGLRGSRAWWWALGSAAAMLVLAYAPNFRDLAYTWWTDENYTHGFLVIPIALFILWRRFDEARWEGSSDIGAAPWWGWGLLVASLIVRTVAYEWSFHWVETATLLPAIVGLAWAFGGPSLLARILPAVLFLVFMLPLPNSVNNLVALPLQRLAATGSYYCLQVAGFWVVQEGNVLHLSTPFGRRPLDVALACSGLKMLMTLAATVTATIMLIPMPRWKQLVVLASAIPIALISNMIRIVTTGWCYYYIEGKTHLRLLYWSKTGLEWGHDISGWMMMPLALILVAIELQLLTWLAPEQTGPPDEDVRKSLLLPLLSGKGTKGSSPMIEE